MGLVISGLGVATAAATGTGYIISCVRGNSSTPTTVNLVATTVRNTSPIWVPVLMEATLGRTAAWISISLIGLYATPGYVLFGVATGSYLLFTSVVKAVKWARKQGPEKIIQVLEQFQEAVQVCEEIAQEKREVLERITEERKAILQAVKAAQRQVSEYSKDKSGRLEIDDPEGQETMRTGAETILRVTMEFLEERTASRNIAEQEYSDALVRLEASKQNLVEAESLSLPLQPLQ